MPTYCAPPWSRQNGDSLTLDPHKAWHSIINAAFVCSWRDVDLCNEVRHTPYVHNACSQQHHLCCYLSSLSKYRLCDESKHMINTISTCTLDPCNTLTCAASLLGALGSFLTCIADAPDHPSLGLQQTAQSEVKASHLTFYFRVSTD